MNPRTIRWQAFVTFALLLVLAFAATPEAVLWLAVPATLWWLFLNATYSYSLGDRGRTKKRMNGDRWVARYIAVGLLAPLLTGVVLTIVDYGQDPRLFDFSVSETSTLVIAPATLFVLILCSSLIDWYYIRPRIDGIVCAPPCRSSGSETWKNPTRWWYLHRGLATLAYMGFALVIALVIMLMLAREDPVAANVIGGVGGLAGVLLIFAGSYRSQIPTVAKFVLSPAYCLGDDLTYEPGKGEKRGFVLHVAVPVTKLVPLDEGGSPTEEVAFIERKNSDLNEADLLSRKTTACDNGCARLNPQCAVPFPRVDERRRLLTF